MLEKILEMPEGYFYEDNKQAPYIKEESAPYGLTPITDVNTIRLPIPASIPAGLPDYSERNLQNGGIGGGVVIGGNVLLLISGKIHSGLNNKILSKTLK